MCVYFNDYIFNFTHTMSSNKNRVELINCSFSSCIINLTSEYIVLILLASIGGSVLNGAVELWGLNFKNELLYVFNLIIGTLFIVEVSKIIKKFDVLNLF